MSDASKCVYCHQPFLSVASKVSRSCNHEMHLSCYDKLKSVHGTSCCVGCFPKAIRSTLIGHFPVDMGDDKDARLMNAKVVPSQAIYLSAVLRKEEALTLETMGKSDAMFDPDKLKDLVVFYLKSKTSPTIMLSKGCTMRHVKAHVSWKEWEKYGYGVKDAKTMGAVWMDLKDMKFGEFWNEKRDYECLGSLDVFGVPFYQLFNDLWHRNWSLLASCALPPVILSKLGLTVDEFIRNQATHNDILLFNYISLEDFVRHLKLTSINFNQMQLSFAFMAQMRWEVPLLERYLAMRIQTPQQLQVVSPINYENYR